MKDLSIIASIVISIICIDAATQVTKLEAPDGRKNDLFGTAVSISGDYAIVGARQHNKKSGAAYIFKRSKNDWVYHSKLTASDQSKGDLFGVAVAIDENRAIVGAVENDDRGENSGSAYIFKRDEDIWFEETKLTANDGQEGDYFGNSVAIDGNYVIVGAVRDDDLGIDSGCAYVFVHDSEQWTELDKITSADGHSGDVFGNAVAIEGNYALVAAVGAEAAYVFRREGKKWLQQARLAAADGTEGDDFGNSVAISGDHCIVGARLDDEKAFNGGSAYVFRKHGQRWLQQAKLTPTMGTTDALFGSSVVLHWNYAVISAPGWVKSRGQVSWFYRDSTQWSQPNIFYWGKEPKSYMGTSLASNDQHLIIGAVGENATRGTAFVLNNFRSASPRFHPKGPSFAVGYDEPPAPRDGFRAIQNALQYPASIRKRGIEGRIIVQVVVTENGEVEDAKVIKSLHPALDRAALNAVKSVVWKPAMLKGKPVKVSVAIPITFRLNR